MKTINQSFEKELYFVQNVFYEFISTALVRFQQTIESQHLARLVLSTPSLRPIKQVNYQSPY